MAGLCGVNVDRTISQTFVMGAALAAVAGLMVTLYYGVIDFFIGFLAGIKAFTAAVLGGIGSIPGAMLGGLMLGLVEAFWSGYFSIAVQGRRGVRDPDPGADLPADRPARPARDREGLRRWPGACWPRPSPRRPESTGRPRSRKPGSPPWSRSSCFCPWSGCETVNVEGGLGLNFRFDWVVIGTAAVFAGRLLLTGARTVPTSGLAAVAAPLRQIPALVAPYRRHLAFAAVVFAFLMPFLPFANRYVVDIGTTVLIYVMLGWGLNIVVGLAGLLDLGYVAFYAVGAYSYALFAHWFELGFWDCLPLAGALAASFGVLLGFPVLRLRGDYLAIVTLGFGEIIRIILLNWWAVTGGPNGISNIPRPTFFGLPFERTAPDGTTAFHEFFGIDYYQPAADHLPLLPDPGPGARHQLLRTLRIRKLPIGRAWEALREDEIACRALGINPTNTKLTAFALGAMFGGFAGSFFATRQGFISPESFTFIESAMILAIVVLGGMGSQIGVVLAAIVLVALPELGREFARVPHAAVRRRHGRDHGLAAARSARPSRADDPPARGGAGRCRRRARHDADHRPTMTRRRADPCSTSSI